MIAAVIVRVHVQAVVTRLEAELAALKDRLARLAPASMVSTSQQVSFQPEEGGGGRGGARGSASFSVAKISQQEVSTQPVEGGGGRGGAHGSASVSVAKISRKEVSTQTEEGSGGWGRGLGGGADGSDSDGLDGPSPAARKRESTAVKFKNAKPAPANTGVYPLEVIMKSIQKVYIVSACLSVAFVDDMRVSSLNVVCQDKIKADMADDMKANPRQDFDDYVDDWLLN